MSSPDNADRYKNQDIKINWKIHTHQFGSIANAGREMALAMARLGCDVKVTDVPADLNRTSLDNLLRPEEEALLQQLIEKPISPDQYYHVRCTAENPIDAFPGKKIHMAGWDYDLNHAGRAFVPEVNASYAAFWAISQHSLAAYVNAGVRREKSYVVPRGVDIRQFHPEVPPKRFPTQKRFVFLFVGLPSLRKGLDLLLPAYMEVFSAKDDVCLVVKTKDFNQRVLELWDEKARRIRRGVNCPEVVYLFDEEPPYVMPSYYAGCDCFVFPTRAESFGQVVPQAMACGAPVITTRWSGLTDFCHPRNSYLLDYDFSEARNDVGNWQLPPGTLWAEPDQEQLKRYLRHAFENREEARAVGLRAHQDIAHDWTWDHSAQKAIDAIRTMESRDC